MTSGVMDILRQVFHLGREMHPELTLSGIKHRGILLLRALLYFPRLREWYDVSDNPMLRLALKRFPLMSGAMYWPYINHTWDMQQRLAAIDQHYRMLNETSAAIAHAAFSEVELARVDEYPGLRLVLDKAAWFIREGEVVLNLFIHDQRFYSLAFTLGTTEGRPVVYIGAVQGSNTEEAPAIYRDMTHALHGLRPRDLLVTSFKMLCNNMGYQSIMAVSSENRQHNSPYFGNSHKEKVLVAYNEIWQEHGGIALTNGFYEMPSTVKRKTMEEIPARKRAAYRRRYEMLDKLEHDIGTNCNRLTQQPIVTAL